MDGKIANRPLYTHVLSDFNKMLMELVHDGHTVALPERVGTFTIVGLDSVVEPIDWGRTNRLWEKDPKYKEEKRLVRCTNEHTDGVSYKHFWSKVAFWAKYKAVYYLKFARGNKRELARRIFEEGAEYQNMKPIKIR